MNCSKTTTSPSSSGSTPPPPGVLVNEVDTLDVTKWDVALAEILPGGVLKAGLPGLSTLTVGTLKLQRCYHLAMSYNQDAQVFSVFLDGTLAAQTTGHRNHPSQASRTANYAFGRGGATNLGGGTWFSGRMDEIRIWSRSLGPEDVQAYYNRIIAPENQGLSAYWQFNIPSSGTSIDSSLKNNPAVYVPVDSTIPLVGSDFELRLLPQSATTLAETVTDAPSVQLNGSANPKGDPVTAWFQWGVNEQYSNTTPEQTLGNGQTPVSFQAVLREDLQPGEYHYRAVANTPNGRVFGGDEVFLLLPVAGTALVLDGTDYLRTALWSRDLFPDENFTFEFWFKATGPGILLGETDTADVSKWDYGFLELLSDGTLKAGVPGLAPISLGTITLGTWSHVALVYDQESKTLSAFLQGQPAGTSIGDRLHPSEQGRTAVYTFGRGGPAHLGPGVWFNGAIDEVRIWNRPLSADDVKDAFDKIRAGLLSGLVGYYRLDSFDQNLSPDASAKQNKAWHVGPPGKGPRLTASTPLVKNDQRPSILDQGVREGNPFLVQFTGKVDLGDLPAKVFFEYGSGLFDSRTEILDMQGNSPVTFASFAEALQPGRPYLFRIVASNQFGVVRSPQGSFLKKGWAGGAYAVTPNQYVRTKSLETFLTSENITIELWFKPKAAGVLIGEFDALASTAWDKSIIEVLPSGSVEAGFTGLPAVTVGRVIFDRWNHVAVRYDKASQKLDTFLNGEKGASSIGDRLTPMEVGRRLFLALGKSARTKLGTGDFFRGEFDEVKVWSYPRSATEIINSANEVSTGAEPGLILCWQFEGTPAAIIADSTPNDNTGQLFGGTFGTSGAPLLLDWFPLQFSPSERITLQFLRFAGLPYRLESTRDFNTWFPHATNTASVNGFVRFTIPQAPQETHLFFRTVLE